MSDALFGLKYPIWQAPTGSIAGPELASAVSNAGGMGAMGLTWTPPEVAASFVRQVLAATDKPFQVNFVLAFPPDGLEACLKAGAKIVTFSWGMPTEWVSMLRDYGAKFGVQVTNAAGAERALEIGADFLICQGNEAGGHVQSSQPLHVVMSNVLAVAGHCPVITAGRMDSGHLAYILLKKGASGVMFGTLFVASEESRAHPEYKRRLVDASDSERSLTVCFDGGWTGAMHGVLRNSTLNAWEAAGCPPGGRRPGEGDVLAQTVDGQPIVRYEDTAPRIGFMGDIESMCLYAGTSVTGVKAILPAAQIVENIAAGLNASA
jgi:nitronate monooxygenase